MTPTINAFSAAIALLRAAGAEPLGMIVSKDTFQQLEFESGVITTKLLASGVKVPANEIKLDGVRIRESRN